MKISLLLLLLLPACILHAQEKVIKLYNGKAPGSENWNWQEGRNDSNIFKTRLIYNVVEPTLTVFSPPSSAVPTGTAVIIAPGGGFHVLSVNTEGVDVAKWLNKKGVTAFVLKYRLVHTVTDNPAMEMFSALSDQKKFDSIAKPVVPLAVNDGLAAVTYVREHAAEYNINPDRIGFMGFSAGGTVAMSVAYNGKGSSHPNFIAPVYAYEGAVIGSEIPAEKTPAFIVAASDDQLALAPHSVSIYNKWLQAKQPAELHIYENGGHGFGMKKQDLPSDKWIERFEDWLGANGLLWPENPTGNYANHTYIDLKNYVAYLEDRLHNDWADLSRYAEENKQLQPAPAGVNRVVFMGNSITEGWKNTDSAFFANHSYVDRGISGQTTPQMLLRFRQDVIALKPAVVVILAGTNDIAGNTGVTTIPTIFGNIVSMAQLAKTANIKVVISSVLPVYDYPWKPGLEPAEKIVTLNKMLKEYAEKNNIVYLDYFTPMADSRKGLKAELGTDGVHPNLAGYKVMEPLVEKAIAEALKRK